MTDIERKAEEWVERNCEPILTHLSDGNAVTSGFKHGSLASAAFLAGSKEGQREAVSFTVDKMAGIFDVTTFPLLKLKDDIYADYLSQTGKEK